MPPPGHSAQQDARRITRHYLSEGGPDLARRFVAALREATDHIRLHPSSGSPAYRTDTGIADLRAWPVRGFPYILFYHDRPGGPVLRRLLHSARDIPATLRAP